MAQAGFIMSIIGLVLQAMIIGGGFMLWSAFKKHQAQFELLDRRWRHDSRALHTGDDRNSRRIEVTENKISALVERIGQVEFHAPTMGAYQYAQQLAGQGAPVDALIERCGLSTGEAELITSIKQLQQKERLSS